ncbi:MULTISPECIES: sporulation protein [Pseudoalteromonas]|jgi:sporulation-control protein|uniref:Sporulation control protein Spo0M n=1 Tax=Pseudoalteromonas lipolytica TaxID=570156 RepID=A0A0N8HKV7_9GAMM|nr:MULTISPECIES: sporulation protein [Pseudoalteromonas]MED5514122.1 sporulation protein [Pseudomonadota bacterium]KPM84952.1 sporulation control protein Spo0M [Pseudoalteromonas lipolytica]MBC7008503.1 sporulation protein [Pseudoalteromonas sp. BZK2]MCF2846431.1 sporulation protein [Pseudoalteromonas sp. PAST1]MCF2915307.1 sporulation protein [Pseudoalteromonas sp. Cn5-37]|tara:strand:- start:55 stop:798 length:744 start_codon:yes stop_codon:yes gene_type:complete
MFKKILASVGIGAAKVDTVLETEHLQPGQKFNAVIVIKGGDVDQEISGLDLALMTRVKVESDDGEYFTNHVIEKWRITDIGMIAAGAEKHIPFEARLHSETPITEINAGYNQSHVWLETGLDIDLALDPTDRDALHIYPNDAVSTLMEAMDRLGFSLVKADVEKGYLKAPTFQSHSGCYQELEYRPNSRSLFGLQEIELSFVPEAHKTHVLIELDRAFRGDGYVDLTIEHDHVNLSQLCDQLERLFA